MESRPGITDTTYVRIRAACCEEHGLGARKGYERNDPRALDDHAAQITATVLQAKKRKGKAA